MLAETVKAFNAAPPLHAPRASTSMLCHAALLPDPRPAALRRVRGASQGLKMMAEGKEKLPLATLTKETEWSMAIALDDGAELAVTACFQEDEGYEPPQGPLIVRNSSFVQGGFWKLGEDPAKEGFDKAGLWIWGLFEEPKYPFIFFELQITKEISTSQGTIAPQVLYAQADLIGLSEAVISESLPCGTFSLRQVS
ncbi:hypothetical protein GUITHDRAFT_143763 [Guillardia theta CCMP2712]|uniref:Uncharacterized protein n=1 Tax=Guillardia theta (strain CCMP2712) TaxID=905079 RepID=L1ISE5_GUITC|nr:hypothetical protein GUITHDRAFT_143763 [Guillardia theta CCMP2712]EKX39163.1 hypothetical protein GUITHDRAFT_143763 [Guillardia theta CCMP2712]|eukprot:XP_005826143.1 hypothetical protein GUITHDRAFT_143763 [Guillardia theta CCMP2712]